MDEMLDDNAKVFTGKYGGAGLCRDHGGGRDATLAMRAEHELGWMTEEMAAIETVGQEVADSGLPGAPAVADALAALRAGRGAGLSTAEITGDYNAATEVLSRCVKPRSPPTVTCATPSPGCSTSASATKRMSSVPTSSWWGDNKTAQALAREFTGRRQQPGGAGSHSSCDVAKCPPAPVMRT